MKTFPNTRIEQDWQLNQDQPMYEYLLRQKKAQEARDRADMILYLWFIGKLLLCVLIAVVLGITIASLIFNW